MIEQVENASGVYYEFPKRVRGMGGLSSIVAPIITLLIDGDHPAHHVFDIID